MGYSIEVNSHNYDTEVQEKSYDKPVVIDFFAPWCGPCQLLKPILEKLVQEYDFILAKIDIDQNPELASQFGIEGVPDVRIVKGGEIFPGFVGALSETQLRNFLSQLNIKSELDLALEEIHQLMASKDFLTTKNRLEELFTKYPDNAQLIFEAARFLVRLNLLEEAQEMVKNVTEDNREYYPKSQAIQTLIELRTIVNNPGESELDQLFAQAARLALAGDYEGAFKLFLQIIEQDRKYGNDIARKTMVSLFHWLGIEHPLTKKYQQQLMLALY